LSHVRSLRILDRKTSIGLRGVKLRTVEIGKEYHTRYFIEGTVRKFGEQIKTSVSLLDIETGDYLWQESFRGEFKDIFDIQESVAKNVVEGLKLHLTKQETSQIVDHGTKDPEAYKLYVKAQEYLDKHTREGFQFAIELVSRAIEHDPAYAAAYAFKADALVNMYRTYHIESTLLDAAKQLANHALELKPDLWQALAPLALIHQLQGDRVSAEAMAHRYVAHAADQSNSHFTLATVFDRAGDYAAAIAPYEKAADRNSDSLSGVWNLVLACHHAGETEKRIHWASVAIPLFERHLKFHPEDEFHLACYASLLHFAGRHVEAKAYADKLSSVRDGTSLYSLACLYCELGDLDAGIAVFRKALDAGYRNAVLLDRFLTSSTTGIGSLAGTPEFEELRAAIEHVSHEAHHV
jgi:adenylate cyclase